jgi:hypothetical protein
VIEKATLLWSSGNSITTIADILGKEGVVSLRSGTPCSPQMVHGWLTTVGDIETKSRPRRNPGPAEPAPEKLSPAKTDLTEDEDLMALHTILNLKMSKPKILMMLRNVLDSIDPVQAPQHPQIRQ